MVKKYKRPTKKYIKKIKSSKKRGGVDQISTARRNVEYATPKIQKVVRYGSNMKGAVETALMFLIGIALAIFLVVLVIKKGWYKNIPFLANLEKEKNVTPDVPPTNADDKKEGYADDGMANPTGSTMATMENLEVQRWHHAPNWYGHGSTCGLVSGCNDISDPQGILTETQPTNRHEDIRQAMAYVPLEEPNISLMYGGFFDKNSPMNSEQNISDIAINQIMDGRKRVNDDMNSKKLTDVAIMHHRLAHENAINESMKIMTNP